MRPGLQTDLGVKGFFKKWQGFLGRQGHSEMGNDMRFVYTDERSRVGHYLEHVWMSPPLLQQMKAIPAYGD